MNWFWIHQSLKGHQPIYQNFMSLLLLSEVHEQLQSLNNVIYTTKNGFLFVNLINWINIIWWCLDKILTLSFSFSIAWTISCYFLLYVFNQACSFLYSLFETNAVDFEDSAYLNIVLRLLNVLFDIKSNNSSMSNDRIAQKNEQHNKTSFFH